MITSLIKYEVKCACGVQMECECDGHKWWVVCSWGNWWTNYGSNLPLPSVMLRESGLSLAYHRHSPVANVVDKKTNYTCYK